MKLYGIKSEVRDTPAKAKQGKDMGTPSTENQYPILSITKPNLQNRMYQFRSNAILDQKLTGFDGQFFPFNTRTPYHQHQLEKKTPIRCSFDLIGNSRASYRPCNEIQHERRGSLSTYLKEGPVNLKQSMDIGEYTGNVRQRNSRGSYHQLQPSRLSIKNPHNKSQSQSQAPIHTKYTNNTDRKSMSLVKKRTTSKYLTVVSRMPLNKKRNSILQI